MVCLKRAKKRTNRRCVHIPLNSVFNMFLLMSLLYICFITLGKLYKKCVGVLQGTLLLRMVKMQISVVDASIASLVTAHKVDLICASVEYKSLKCYHADVLKEFPRH